MPFKFEKLEIWKLAIEFSDRIHTMTKKFLKEELYGLRSQFNRAGDSISLNIAEGSIGQSDPEQKKFVGYAIRSLAETVNCLYLAKRKNYITQEEFKGSYAKAEELFAKMNKFRNRLSG